LLTPGSFHEAGGYRDQGEKTKYYTGQIPKGYILEQGDLLLAMTEQAEGLLGSALRVPASDRFLHNQRLGLVILNRNSSLILDYVYWLYNYPEVRRIISASSSGTKVHHTSPSKLLDIDVPVPPLTEQRKIADILSTWDEALETLDTLIAAKDRQKQALMQQLLNRSLAHSQTSHARHRLGEVCERVTRRNNSASENVLTISAQQGLVSQKDYFNRSVAGADLANYYLLNRGEFAYNRSSAKGYPYGAIKRLDCYDTGVVSTLYLCFRIKPKAEVSSNYLSQYFEAGRLNSGLRSVAKEGARAHGLLNVTADEFFDLDIFLPTLAEQQQIAAILDTADQELTLLRTQHQTLDQQKRGLMQRLLTGKIRVTPTPESNV
jgi:type I restriction enzyme S subunit